MQKNRNIILSGIFFLIFLLICVSSLQAVTEGNLEDAAISEDIEVNLEVEKYGMIDIPEDNILDLTVDYSEQEEEIREKVMIDIAANTDIDLTIEQVPEEFGNKLDEWLSYEYKYNNTTMSFGTDSNGSASVSSFLDSEKKEIEFAAIFDLESAREGEWWQIDADTYEDIVLRFTISSSE